MPVKGAPDCLTVSGLSRTGVFPRPPSYAAQHLGGGSSASQSQHGAEAHSQQQLTRFLKNLGGYSSLTFVMAGEDGVLSMNGMSH